MKKRNRNIITLGLLTVIATVMFVWGMFWLLGSPVLKGGTEVTVALNNGGGLKRSDPVQLHGVRVGTVKSVALGETGGVHVTLRLDDKYAIASDTRATVRGDVFGAHFVELVPGVSMLRLNAGDTIQGMSPPQLAQMASDLTAKVERVLVGADSLLSPAAVRDVHATASVLPAGAAELRAAFAELRLASAALRRTAENVETAEAGSALRGALGEVENSARALSTAATRMEQTFGSITTLVTKIDAGNGTLGKLVNDSSMYLELNHTLREVRALATDIRERPTRYFQVKIF